MTFPSASVMFASPTSYLSLLVSAVVQNSPGLWKIHKSMLSFEPKNLRK